LALIRENSRITAKEMAEKTELSERTIRNILAELQKNQLIERIGARKEGIWILKN
jgi:predicted HTH transcriptional regulator